MEVAHRKFGSEWGQFDRYCKLALYHEAIDYLRELQRYSDHEKPLDALSPEEWDKLSTVDCYPSDSFVFSSHGYSLYIDHELVAAAFADLPQQEQSILILCFVLGMTDGEIGRIMGMSRSAVQRHRTGTLKQLRTQLLALAKRRLMRMKRPVFKGQEPLPDSIIDAACAGDSDAIERVLQYYDGYINKLCTRRLYDASGQFHVRIDE